MTILALEFSSSRRSAAVARGGNVLAEAAADGGGRGTNAFGLIEKVLAEAKIGREEIEAIAVGLGPGSYTGIRAAISIAQGWQLARGIKLLGVSSVEAIAAGAQAGKIFGRVNVMIDAQRNEFYLAVFEVSADGFQKIEPLKVVTFVEIQSRPANEIPAGPEVVKWFPHGRAIFPRASTLAQLAALRSDFIAGEKLEPVYLREVAFVKASAGRTLVV
ncbi:MAG TPA: tRNA (adenosine(37)-N6)-threonylcarbamoyltransferase complex dimerization subunit type 1 TsaB [Candidatus Aquilonibacter sp.]|nr:tRNA (adenosine(37)-N6)-threonylcarbamoyltransferase complex dimerization subunit type 1 TsaB [Candidatus Aquilonibacter sp.]